MTDLTISEVQQLLDETAIETKNNLFFAPIEDEDIAKHSDDWCDHIGREVHAYHSVHSGHATSPERLVTVSVRLTFLTLLAATAGGCLGYAALYVASGF